MNKFLIGITFIALTGCATTQPFQPTSNVKESLEEGPSFAHYDVRTGAGDFGMVRVDLRTTGIQEEDAKEKEAPAQLLVQVRMDVANNSSKSVTLDTDKVALQLIVDEKKRAGEIKPSFVPSDTQIAGHAKKYFVFEFPLPKDTKSKQVDAFELSWGLSMGTENYNQMTGFSRKAPNEDVYYVYDPFFTPWAGYSYYGGPHRSRSSLNLGVGFGF